MRLLKKSGPSQDGLRFHDGAGQQDSFFESSKFTVPQIVDRAGDAYGNAHLGGLFNKGVAFEIGP